MQILKSRCFHLAVLFLIMGALPACSTRDEFPMRNPQTGAEVTCHSGHYSFEESAQQIDAATQCIHACERYGFRLETGNPYADAPQPAAPHNDMKQDIPAVCLP